MLPAIYRERNAVEQSHGMMATYHGNPISLFWKRLGIPTDLIIPFFGTPLGIPIVLTCP